jgi:hypothetical protein
MLSALWIVGTPFAKIVIELPFIVALLATIITLPVFAWYCMGVHKATHGKKTAKAVKAAFLSELVIWCVGFPLMAGAVFILDRYPSWTAAASLCAVFVVVSRIIGLLLARVGVSEEDLKKAGYD